MHFDFFVYAKRTVAVSLLVSSIQYNIFNPLYDFTPNLRKHEFFETRLYFTLAIR